MKRKNSQKVLKNEENQIQENDQEIQEPEPEQIGEDYSEENEY